MMQNIKLIRYLIFFSCTFFLTIAVSAETVTGCRIGNDPFLYTGYQGVKPYPVSQYYIPTFATYTTPTKDFLQAWYNDYSSCPRFVGNPSYGAQCAVPGITVVANGSVQNLGNTITYTITYNCPIDNWLPVGLIMISFVAVHFIRKS
ncbi:MAG: hypothetical protein V4541_07305 [Bacteroidota bacterium]